MKRKDIGLMMVGLVGLLLCGGLIMAVRESASHPETQTQSAVVPVEIQRPSKDTSTDLSAATPKSITVPIKFGGVGTGTVSRAEVSKMPLPVRPVASK